VKYPDKYTKANSPELAETLVVKQNKKDSTRHLVGGAAVL